MERNQTSSNDLRSIQNFFESAKIERLRTDFILSAFAQSSGEEFENPGPGKRDGSGRRVPPSHAVEESSGGELRAHTRTNSLLTA